MNAAAATAATADLHILFVLLYYSYIQPTVCITTNDFECPRSCICIPDIAEPDRFVINCKWSSTGTPITTIATTATTAIPATTSGYRWKPEIFDQFPLNATKTLSIECISTDSVSSSPIKPIIFDENLFRGFVNLQHLRIQKCRIYAFPNSLLHTLSNLRSIYFNQLNVPNEKLTLPDQFFRNTKRLEKLIITNCNLDSLPKSLLCDCPYIQVINISNNLLSSANLNIAGKDISTDNGDAITTANSSLTFKCNNKAEQLIIVDISSNQIRSINDNDFKQLIAIRQLFLANNQISIINRNAFKACTLLQQLHIGNNSIEELPILPETIIHLDASWNHLSIIPITVANLPNLHFLNLSGNAIDANTPFPINSKTIQTIDLSGNQLEFVPENLFPRNSEQQQLQHFLLSSNRITQLESFFFQNFSNLQSLDVSSNRIAQIDVDDLQGLISLTYLNLFNNSIYHLDMDLFEATSQLQELNLGKNLLIEVPLALGRLFKLRYLDLSNNQISKTYKFLFNKLPNLQRLNFRKNKLATIDSYIFSDMPRLIELDLSFNTIDHLAEDAFSKCPKLRQLDLSGNYLTNFNGAFQQLQSLKLLNSSFNMFQLLQWSEFPATLTHLDMSNNQITLISSTQQSRIRHVELQRNRIMALTDEQIPDTVEYLNLSNNLIHTINNGTFRNKQFLKGLALEKNQLTSLELAALVVDNPASDQPIRLSIADNPLDCSCEMDWIRNNNNEKSLINVVDANRAFCLHRIHKQQILLSEIKKDDLLCNYKQICEPNCICCQYGNCDCKSKCPDGCLCYYSDLTYTTNIVRCIALESKDQQNFSPKDIPMYATHIYLEQMNISTVRSHDFLGRTRLLHLHLIDSSIEEIQPLAFNTLPSLQLLDLSGNYLIRLTGDELYRTNKITTLLLHNNHLMSLGDRLNEVMPQLKTITLHNNRLQDLPLSIEQYGKQITNITLGANLFRCDCLQRFRMQHWFTHNFNVINDISDIFCVENITHAALENDTTILSAYPPNFGTDIFQISMQQFIASANTTICATTASGIFGTDGATNSFLIILILFAVALITTTLIMLAVVLLRKTNSVIVQRRYKVPPSFTGTHTTPGSSPLPLIHYDAFISYSKKDEKLIIDTLCRQLESEEYILCLLHRDGPNYNSRVHTISDELINQMECAQSLIIVLTQYFLDNEWKTLQIKISHQIFAKNRHKKLIALLGDGIEANQLDAELGQILRKNTCIRMNDPLFWNLLHSALPVRITPSSCSVGSSQIYSDCYGSIVPSDII